MSNGRKGVPTSHLLLWATTLKATTLDNYQLAREPLPCSILRLYQLNHRSKDDTSSNWTTTRSISENTLATTLAPTLVKTVQPVSKTELDTPALARSDSAVNSVETTISALFPTEAARTELTVPTVSTALNVLATVLSSEPLALMTISVPVETVAAKTERHVSTGPVVPSVLASGNSLERPVPRTSTLAPQAPLAKTEVLARTTAPADTLAAAKPTSRATIAKPLQICARSSLA